jgi:LysM repeat protein
MEYGTNSKYEEYEEAPESLLRSQKPRLSSGRKPLLLLLAGGGILIFLILVISFFTGKSDRQAAEPRKTIHLGSSQDLPESDVQTRDLRVQAAVSEVQSALEDLQGRLGENHDKSMESVSLLNDKLDAQAEYLEALVNQVRELTSRLEVVEKEFQASSSQITAALAEVSKAAGPPVERQKPKQESAPKEPGIKYYTIEQKDTLYSIARKNNIKLETLLKLNGLREDSVIHPGDRLRISK